MTPVTERLANVPYESITEVIPSGVEYQSPDRNIPPADNGYGFDSVLRNGVINIEPVNDDYESGLGFGETGCPQYEDGGAVQLITIAPTEGGNFSDEDEGMQGNSNGCAQSATTVPSAAAVRTPEEMENSVSVHMEYVGTLSTSELQPEVLQQIALSLQPLDAQRVPFSSSCVASSAINEFSCSEDEVVEPSVPDNRTLEPSGTSKRTPEPNSASKKKTVEPETGCPLQSATKELDDCVISRVERRVSRKSNRGVNECEQAPGSARTAASGKAPSNGRSASGESPNAVAQAQRLASTSHATPVVTATASSDTVCNLVEAARAVPWAVPRPFSATRLPATVSTGPMLSFEEISAQGRSEAITTRPMYGESFSKCQQPINDPSARKRKGAIGAMGPPAKRKKSLKTKRYLFGDYFQSNLVVLG